MKHDCNALYHSAILAFFMGMTAILPTSCKKESMSPEGEKYPGGGNIVATVTLPSQTKVEYSEVDGTGKASGLKSVWTEDDYFYALTDAGQMFRFDILSGEGTAKAVFTAEAYGITETTRWVAVLGKNISTSSSQLTCSYTGQDGTLPSLGDYDFIAASSVGLSPNFDFADGMRSSYFMRMKLPAGVRYIEYCVAASWQITSSKSDPYYAVTPQYDGHFNNVSMIDLGRASNAGEVCYIAIPAGLNNDYIQYKMKGCIFTFFNEGMTQSNGKVLHADLRGRGGLIGTFDLSAMQLIDRPLKSEAINFGSVMVQIKKDGEGDGETGVNKYNNLNDYVMSTAVSPSWAPFNLGAKQNGSVSTADYYSGTYYSWGEIASRTTFSSSEYTYDGTHTVGQIEGFASTQIGYMRTLGVSGMYANGTMRFQRIAGTKFDAARVQWGSEWRMPRPEEMMMFTGSSLSVEGVSTTASGFQTSDITTDYYGVGRSLRGRKFTKGGQSIFFPYCGRCLGGTKWQTARGFYWTDSRIRATPSNAALTNAPLIAQITPGVVHYGTTTDDQNSGVTQDPYYGFNIRPVLNVPESDYGATSPSIIEDGAELYHGSQISPNSNLYGVVQDIQGNGIAGVTVSDGYSCVSTDVNGVYQMRAASGARTVAVSIPAAYQIPVDASGNVLFYSHIESLPKEQIFTLTPRASIPDRVTVIAVTDEHVSNRNSGVTRFPVAMADVQATVNTLATGLPVGPAGESAGEVIGISMGDQMWDEMNYAQNILDTFRSVERPAAVGGGRLPFFYTIGNHDYDNSKGNDYDCETAYVNAFGPTNYSFDVANVHFIVMDDIIMTSNGADNIIHKEGFTTSQVEWLKADVAKVKNKSDKVVVFCTHAPLNNASAGDTGTQSAVMSQLKNNFKAVHVFSGHNHNAKNNYYAGWTALGGRNITEHTIQALCGYWWKANIAYVTGSPAGYGVYTFDSNDLYAEYNKLVNARAGFQARVYKGNDTYNKNSAWDEMMHGGSRGYKEYTWESPAKGSKYVVRLWDAASTNDPADVWTVNIGSTALTRVATPIKDAAAASYVFNKANKSGDYGDANGTTDQLWYGGSISGGFTCTVTHTLPSGWSATYTTTRNIGTDYEGFAYGSNYDGF